jgi:hypothetical protein
MLSRFSHGGNGGSNPPGDASYFNGLQCDLHPRTGCAALARAGPLLPGAFAGVSAAIGSRSAKARCVVANRPLRASKRASSWACAGFAPCRSSSVGMDAGLDGGEDRATLCGIDPRPGASPDCPSERTGRRRSRMCRSWTKWPRSTWMQGRGLSRRAGTGRAPNEG